MGFLVVRQLKKNLYFVCVLPYTNKGVQICSELLSPPPPQVTEIFQGYFICFQQKLDFREKN